MEIIVPLSMACLLLTVFLLRRFGSDMSRKFLIGIGLYFLLVISAAFLTPRSLQDRYATVMSSISAGCVAGINITISKLNGKKP
jgi:hypothetical protein